MKLVQLCLPIDLGASDRDILGIQCSNASKRHIAENQAFRLVLKFGKQRIAQHSFVGNANDFFVLKQARAIHSTIDTVHHTIIAGE